MANGHHENHGGRIHDCHRFAGGAMIYVTVAAGALVAFAVARLVWRYTIAIVDGSSMEPTLWAGDRLLVRRCAITTLRRGDIVVVRESLLHDVSRADGPAWAAIAPAQERFLVKRAVAIPGDPLPQVLQAAEGVVPLRAIVIVGDNPCERGYGYVGEEQLVGRAVRRLGE
jgi:signal peptidase I